MTMYFLNSRDISSLIDHRLLLTAKHQISLIRLFNGGLMKQRIIIVVIITRPSEEPSQKKNSDITVFRVSDSFKGLMFMQNFELDIMLFSQLKASIYVWLFSVCCLCYYLL